MTSFTIQSARTNRATKLKLSGETAAVGSMRVFELPVRIASRVVWRQPVANLRRLL
jgi:hypothetical protein